MNLGKGGDDDDDTRERRRIQVDEGFEVSGDDWLVKASHASRSSRGFEDLKKLKGKSRRGVDEDSLPTSRRADSKDASRYDDGAKRSYNLSLTDRINLHNAAVGNNWKQYGTSLGDERVLTAAITNSGESALHIAVATKKSHEFVKNYVNSIAECGLKLESLRTYTGNTALHYAAKVGNVEDARVLVEGEEFLIFSLNSKNQNALHIAADNGQRRALEYLLNQLKFDLHLPNPMDINLLISVIRAEFYDIALQILKWNPELAISVGQDGSTALQVLIETIAPQVRGDQRRSAPLLGLNWKRETMKNLQQELLNMLCSNLFRYTESYDRAVGKFGRAMLTAIRSGTGSGTGNILLHYAELFYSFLDSYILELWFRECIKYHQMEVLSFLFNKKINTRIYGLGTNSMLSDAAKLPPPDVLNTRIGPLLQLQHELIWFKQVEHLAARWETREYQEGQTPRTVFLDEHRKLIDEAIHWKNRVAVSVFVAAVFILIGASVAAIPVMKQRDLSGVRDVNALIVNITLILAMVSSAVSMGTLLFVLRAGWVRDGRCDFVRYLPYMLSVGYKALYVSIISITTGIFHAMMITWLHNQYYFSWGLVLILVSVPMILTVEQWGLFQELDRCASKWGLFQELDRSIYARKYETSSVLRKIREWT